MGLEERSQRKNERGKTWGKYQRTEGIHYNRRGTIQVAAWRDPVQVYLREGRKAEVRKATYPSLWDCGKDQPVQKNATHGILLA